jgi:RIP metalloprotease RseP
MANAVFTYLSLLLLVLLTGIEVPQAGVRIPSVNNPQGPAARAGILPGDIILQAGGQDLGDTHSMDRFRQLIEASPQKPIPLIILREGSQITKVVTPSAQGKIEVGLSPNILIRAPQNPLEPLSAAGVRFWDLAGTTVSNFGQLFTGKVGVDQLSSPVGIVKMAADVSATNPLSLLYMTALISFSLAFLNILPIPGLDGSHLAFLLIEAIRGKPVSEAIQNRLLQTGLVFLMGLSAMLIFKDSFNWLLKGSPF